MNTHFDKTGCKKAQVKANLHMLLAYLHSLHAETTEVNVSGNWLV
jgi:hypothetical protein